MPLQDKSRPDRKQKRRKVICTDTGQIYNSASDMAEQLGIATQTAYNIVRRKQKYHGLTFQYMDDAEQTNRNETEVHNHD